MKKILLIVLTVLTTGRQDIEPGYYDRFTTY